MRTITFRFFKLFKSNKGLIEPISTFILIVVLAVGAVFSSNLVSQQKSLQSSQAVSCPPGFKECSEDYGDHCGAGNLGQMPCHKFGCSVNGSGGAGCSWGAGSYCETDKCEMPKPVTPPPPPVIPESERCGHCGNLNSCYQGHWVGNDCCFHTELDREKGCSAYGVTPQATPTLAPGARPPVPTPDTGGEQKCPCEYQGRCYPNQETGYWCGNDCRLHPGSDEDLNKCQPKQPTPTMRQATPIRLPTPTAVTPTPAGKCPGICSGKGYNSGGCISNPSIDKYVCGTVSGASACFLDKITISNTDCEGINRICTCGYDWDCGESSIPGGCSDCCQKTLTPTPTPIPTNTPTPPSNLPATCVEACGGGVNAICGPINEGLSCGENTYMGKFCVFSEKKETRECDNCFCTRRYNCDDADIPADCGKCCPKKEIERNTCICSANNLICCGLGGLSCTRCPGSQKCTGEVHYARCADVSAQTAEAEPVSVPDTLSTFSGHGEASSPAKNAKITLKDPEGKKYVVKTDENGDYTITVPTDRIYDVTIESSGYKTLVFKWDSKMGLDYLMNFKLVKKAKAESGNFEIEEATKDRLLVGWNLISLPVKPSRRMKASDLISQINQSGGLVVSVSRWQDGRWETYLAGLNKNDFVIEVGRAYFVENFNETQYKIEGEEITQPQTLNLKPGWNAIGLPKTASCPAASCSAKQMMNVLDKQVPLSAKIFSQFESGLWQAVSKEGQQFYGWDFAIKSNAGYFVKVSKPVQLLP